MRYWEIIADNLSKAGCSWGCVSALDCEGRTIWIVDAHRDEVRKWGKGAQHIQWFEIDYPRLVCDPEPEIKKLVEFLGVDRLPKGECHGLGSGPGVTST